MRDFRTKKTANKWVLKRAIEIDRAKQSKQIKADQIKNWARKTVRTKNTIWHVENALYKIGHTWKILINSCWKQKH